jgi:hypothetical protein
MEKICVRCQSSLDISLFYKHKYSKDGLGSWCKICLTKRTAEKRREAGVPLKKIGIDHEKNKERQKEYRRKRLETFVYTITEKFCYECKQTKDISYFRKNITKRDGYDNKCKKCYYIICTDSRKAYEINKWEKRLLAHAKKHAKSEVLIDEQFIKDLYEKQNGKCYWFNVDLQPSNICKYPWQPSLDRLDRDKGYTKDNVVLACYTANIGRNTNDKETFEAFVIDLKKALNDKNKI